MTETNPWAQYIADNQALINTTRKNIARDQALLAAGQGDPRILNLQIQAGLDYIASLQQQIDTIYLPNYNEWQASRLAPPASAGGIVGNANQARDENASATLPSPPPQVLTPNGRIEPAGSGPNGVGQISGTNAIETPTQQNNPTVGTNAETRPISQTQATTYNNNGTLTQAQLAALQQAPGSSSTNQNPVAPSGGPGAGAGADAGGTNPAKAVSPFPQYRAQTQSAVYQANEVFSIFRQGKFEQVIKGTGYWQSTTTNTTETNAQQRVDPTTLEGYGVNEMGRTKTQQSRPASTSTQASVRAVDNAIIASTQAAVVDTFSKIDALGNFTGNYN
jgi:hypothetical protein